MGFFDFLGIWKQANDTQAPIQWADALFSNTPKIDPATIANVPAKFQSIVQQATIGNPTIAKPEMQWEWSVAGMPQAPTINAPIAPETTAKPVDRMGQIGAWQVAGMPNLPQFVNPAPVENKETNPVWPGNVAPEVYNHIPNLWAQVPTTNTGVVDTNLGNANYDFQQKLQQEYNKSVFGTEDIYKQKEVNGIKTEYIAPVVEWSSRDSMISNAFNQRVITPEQEKWMPGNIKALISGLWESSILGWNSDLNFIPKTPTQEFLKMWWSVGGMILDIAWLEAWGLTIPEWLLGWKITSILSKAPVLKSAPKMVEAVWLYLGNALTLWNTFGLQATLKEIWKWADIKSIPSTYLQNFKQWAILSFAGWWATKLAGMMTSNELAQKAIAWLGLMPGFGFASTKIQWWSDQQATQNALLFWLMEIYWIARGTKYEPVVETKLMDQWFTADQVSKMWETYDFIKKQQPGANIPSDVMQYVPEKFKSTLDNFVQKPEEKFQTKQQTNEPTLANKNAEKIAYDLENKYPVKVDMVPRGKDVVELSKIEVDNGQRNKWIGTTVMKEIIKWADDNWISIALTPDTSLWSSKWRLKQFYKDLWFVDNSGKTKNFQTRESMIRVPEKINTPVKQWSIKTEEWKFSYYDINKNHPTRWDMFTVQEDKWWWIVKNANVPIEMQNQWIATNFYKRMNDESIRSTGNPLRSTQPITLINWEVVHELSKDWIALWDGLVKQWLATKIWDKNYVMNKESKYQDQNNTEFDKNYIETPEFKNWFGDRKNDPANASKVVDSEGKPLVVYHGTNREFNTFVVDNWRNEASSLWSWFVDNKKIADTFANTEIIQYYYTDPKTWKDIVTSEKTDSMWLRENKDLEGKSTHYRVIKTPKIMQLYLDIKNPKVYESSPDWKIDSFELMMDDRDKVSWATYMVWTKRSESWVPYERKEVTSKQFTDHLKDQWYDWIILKNTEYDWWWKTSDQFVAFEPNQIKSATENVGTFNSNNNDIRFQRKETTNMWTSVSTEKAIAIAKKYLPEVPMEILDRIVTPEWLEAYGKYIDGMISFAKDPINTTPTHEVLHWYFDLFTAPKRQQDILNIIKEEQWFTDDTTAEERLADNFVEYVKNMSESLKENQSISIKILDFFDELRNNILSVFGKWDKIKELYKDIVNLKRPEVKNIIRSKEVKFKINQLQNKEDKANKELKDIPIFDLKWWKEYLDKVEPIFKSAESITAETTDFGEMTSKELTKFYESGKYDKLSDFEQQNFDEVMNKQVFVNPMEFMDPERQRFIDRIAQLEHEEQRIWKVGNQTVSKEFSNKQSIKLAWKRKSIMEDMQEHYQLESTDDAYNMYIQLRDLPEKQIKYVPKQSRYVSKSEKQQRTMDRVNKARTSDVIIPTEEVERKRANILGNVMTLAREKGNDVTEAKAMIKFLDVKDNSLLGNKPTDRALGDNFYVDNTPKKSEAKAILKTNSVQDIMEWAMNWRENNIKPIGTHLEEISKSVYGRVKKYDYTIMKQWQKDMELALPFLDNISKLEKNNPDEYFKLWLALSNRDAKMADKILSENGWERPKQLMDRIYAEWEEAWYSFWYLEDYFPRRVKDSKGLIGDLRHSPDRSYIEDSLKRIKELRGVDHLSIDEEAEIINMLLMWKPVDGVMLWSPNMKDRSIELVTKDLLKYYYKPQEALVMYIRSMREAIETWKLFWNSGSLDDSLWFFIAREIEAWTVAYEDAAEVTELLKAKFNKAMINPFLNRAKTIWYTASLGSYTSTITQIWDLSFSIIENGIFRTLKELWKSILGRSKIKAKDFWLEDIGEEFAGWGMAKRFLNIVFKGTWFAWMDARWKEVYINSTFDKLVQEAKNWNQARARDVEEYFWDKMWKQIMDDLKNGIDSDNVRTYLFLKLSDIQPLTSTELPKWHQNNPNARVFYMLKTFALKQLDYVRKRGVKEAINNPKVGIPKLARMLTIIMVMNGISDELKNITTGRKYNSIVYRLMNWQSLTPALKSMFWDNLFKVFWLTKYNIYDVKQNGIDKALTAIFLSVPPLAVPGNILSDIIWAIGGKTSFADLKSIQMIPWIGKPMYRWAGKWQADQQKLLQTESKANTKKSWSGGFVLPRSSSSKVGKKKSTWFVLPKK